MNNEDHRSIENLWLWLTPEQRTYLKTIVEYKYTFLPDLAEQLEDLGLIISHGRLLIPTKVGRKVAKLC
jgi:hypothetical protein